MQRSPAELAFALSVVAVIGAAGVLLAAIGVRATSPVLAGEGAQVVFHAGTAAEDEGSESTRVLSSSAAQVVDDASSAAPIEPEDGEATEAPDSEDPTAAPTSTAQSQPTPAAQAAASGNTETLAEADAATDDAPGGDAAPTEVATPDAPLRVWIGGDSLAHHLGASLVRMGIDDPRFDGVLDNRGSSGLVRPDFFDWPAHLGSTVVPAGYDVLVLVLGANDQQGIVTADGAIYEPGGALWREEYRSRVGEVMDMASGARLVWVGMPPMASPELSEFGALVNAIVAEEAEARPWVTYVDGWELLSGPEGEYTTTVDTEQGEVTVREPDGVHVTAAGGRLLAEAVLGEIAP